MKPPPFDYHDPSTIPEALSLLARHENALPLAGGQSLMPMLNMRYAFPDHLVDLNRITELAYIRRDGAWLAIGAMTRQRDIELSDEVARHCPVLAEAIQHVGHVQTRNRGTLGGSLAHFDPAAELPLICAVTGAELLARGPSGARRIPFGQFALGYMATSLEADELLTEVRLPVWTPGHGFAFEEFARRHGDFALASAAVLLEVGPDRRITRGSVTVGGASEVPVQLEEAAAGLIGEVGSPLLFDAASRHAESIEAVGDMHAPANYRQHLAAVLVRRALARAWTRAVDGASNA